MDAATLRRRATLLAEAAIYAHCVWHFATTGRATPAPIDAPRKLVVHGLYRWVRNPMYLGVVVVGEAVFFLSPLLALYAVFLASAFQIFVLGYEEPALRDRFGAIYTDYCSTVSRWRPRRPRRRSFSAPGVRRRLIRSGPRQARSGPPR